MPSDGTPAPSGVTIMAFADGSSFEARPQNTSNSHFDFRWWWLPLISGTVWQG
jgi:hypothetical protein